MESKPSPFSEKLSLYLSYIEIGALFISFVGLSLFYLQVSAGREFVLIGFTVLSSSYFLSAFTLPPPGDGQEPDKAPQGFIDLFVKNILKKVIYIGCSVSIIGLLFGFLGLSGGGEMLLIGATSLIASSLLCGFALLRKGELMNVMQGPLMRAVPIGLLSAYWLYAHWPLKH